MTEHIKGDNNAVNAVGAPTKYRKEYAGQAYKLTLLGYTDKQLANFFEVSEDTIHEWKKVYPEFSESVKKGKDIADGNVAASLYKRATGFTKSGVEKVFQYEGSIVRAKTKQYFPPEPGAAMNWLKNRQKDVWRDKLALDLDFDKMTEEQIDAIIDRIKKQAQ